MTSETENIIIEEAASFKNQIWLHSGLLKLTKNTLDILRGSIAATEMNLLLPSNAYQGLVCWGFGMLTKKCCTSSLTLSNKSILALECQPKLHVSPRENFKKLLEMWSILPKFTIANSKPLCQMKSCRSYENWLDTMVITWL